MSDRYQHVVRMVRETPWAILPETFERIREVVAARAAGEKWPAEEVAARISGGPGQGGKTQRSSGVAILPLYGVLVPKANLFTEMSGGTSLEMWGQSLEDLAANPAVSAILLDVNSPGGSVSLVPETAARVRAARASKPVVAIANTIAASAAYWIAAQADEIVVTPSGSVGSIGVFAEHDDFSAALEKEGVKVSLISAGRFKVEANPYEPLSDEARQAIQRDVDEFYGMFTRDVAQGRGVETDAVRAGFGEGRMVMANAAVSAGMADRVDTFDATLARLLRGSVSGRPHRAVDDDMDVTATLAHDEPAVTDDGATEDAERREATVRTFLIQQQIKEAFSR